MPTTAQDFLAIATQKAVTELITALELLPVEKRSWKPAESARSAMDMIAECAILNGSTADTITTRAQPSAEFMAEFFTKKQSLAENEAAALALLKTNTARVIEVIQSVSDEDLDVEVPMPWGLQAIRTLCAYPFWNMTYHQGQIVYISSLLGK